jgi:hypothetical protein
MWRAHTASMSVDSYSHELTHAKQISYVLRDGPDKLRLALIGAAATACLSLHIRSHITGMWVRHVPDAHQNERMQTPLTSGTPLTPHRLSMTSTATASWRSSLRRCPETSSPSARRRCTTPSRSGLHKSRAVQTSFSATAGCDPFRPWVPVFLWRQEDETFLPMQGPSVGHPAAVC